jgi:hypothetical protein
MTKKFLCIFKGMSFEFDFLARFEIISKINSGYESGDQVCAFD